MKTFIIRILLVIIVALGAILYFSVGNNNQTVQETEEKMTSQVDEAREKIVDAGERGKDFLQAKLEALEIRPEDIRRDLEEQGEVIRRKAREVGEVVSDQVRDAQVTATIKAKFAADPDLSTFSISVSSTDGRVTLSGEVESFEMIGKAITIALETENVREVVSSLMVE